VLLQLATAGLQFPLLVKPLVSAATDSVRPTGEAAAAAAAPGNSSAALPAAAAIDGHTIGVIFTNEALRTLVEQQQQPQQIPIALPAVLQQYVPHEALYKVSCNNNKLWLHTAGCMPLEGFAQSFAVKHDNTKTVLQTWGCW
jgi:hypothetical protein